MTPRIAYILGRPPGYSETFIGAEISAVRSAGATVEVFVARPRGGPRRSAGPLGRALVRHPAGLATAVRTLGPSWAPRALLAGAYATRLLPGVAAFGPDVIHAHFVNLPTAVAVLLGRKLGVPVTATAHAADFRLDRDGGALDRRLRRLAHLFVISAATAGQLAAKGVTMPEVPHSVVRAACDGVARPEPDRSAEPDRSDPPGPARLVTVARLVEKKGIDTALDAVARLRAAGCDLRYDIYGDGPLRRRLERRAVALGLAGAVTFHGAVPHATATQAVGAADLAVLACRRAADGDLDGIPVFLMEAAGRGIPVVTTAVSGIPELVGPGGGWLVPPADPAALAGALGEVLADAEGARGRGAALRRRLQIEFDPGVQAERLLTVWRGLGSPA